MLSGLTFSLRSGQTFLSFRCHVTARTAPPRQFLRALAAAALSMVVGWTAGCRHQGVTISSLEELREYAARDEVNVRMKPGTYTLETAESHRFLEFTGRRSRYDLRGVTLRVDTSLFSKFGQPPGRDGFYRVIDLSGDGSVIEGARIETFGDHPGLQSRNKLVNVTGSSAELRDLVLTTAGSSPWGYGSLFGISGGVVRKMNGIRIGAPAVGARVIGCRVHMRAMGHAIFVQGASDTLIEDCHIDGLLRRTDEILAETSGPAFERHFRANRGSYAEGVTVGPQGEILPGEMLSLSEDGIRLYDKFDGVPTGVTTIRGCTVVRMRRGICTGLGPAADRVEGCEVRECIATGFNAGTGDAIENCKSDARYGEALSLPYPKSRGARVDLQILDSRDRLGNDLLAVINGQRHTVRLHTADPNFVPSSLEIVLGTNRGYAFTQPPQATATDITLINETPARVVGAP